MDEPTQELAIRDTKMIACVQASCTGYRLLAGVFAESLPFLYQYGIAADHLFDHPLGPVSLDAVGVSLQDFVTGPQGPSWSAEA